MSDSNSGSTEEMRVVKRKLWEIGLPGNRMKKGNGEVQEMNLFSVNKRRKEFKELPVKYAGFMSPGKCW